MALVPSNTSRTVINWEVSMKQCWALVGISESLFRPTSFLTKSRPPWALIMATPPRYDDWRNINNLAGAYLHYMVTGDYSAVSLSSLDSHILLTPITLKKIGT